MKPENKATLTKILTYHVVPGKLDASDLTDGKKLKTVEGEELTVKQAGRQDLDRRRQGRNLDGHDLQRQSVERRDPCGRHRADAGVLSSARALTGPNRVCATGEPGQPGSLFCERDRLAGIDLIACMAVTKRRFPAYNTDVNELQPGNSHVQPSRQRRAHATATPAKVIQPAWVRAHALDQRGRDDPDDHVGLADLQRLAAVRFHAFRASITLGGWLGGALLWHFAAMWLLMVNGLIYLVAGSCHRPLPQEAAADHAGGRDLRYQGGADLQARRMTISPNTIMCRSCSMPASSSVGIVIVLSGLSIWKPVQLQ